MFGYSVYYICKPDWTTGPRRSAYPEGEIMMDFWYVLVVEADTGSPDMITSIFTRHGIAAEVAANQDECMAMLKAVVPTFIVADLALPTGDCCETLKEIRANPRTAHIPVVAVAANNGDPRLADFDAVFTRPLDATTFIMCLADLLRTRHEHRLEG